MNLTSAPPVKVPIDKGGKGLSDIWVQWFSLLYNLISALFDPDGGGAVLNFPAGAFSNPATQTLAAANTPYVCVLTVQDAGSMTLAANKMYIRRDGVYNCQFSLQFENSATSITEVWVWLRKNGVDVAGTASTWSVTSKHGAVNGYMVGACNFFVNAVAGDYFELIVAAGATGINLEAYPSSTSPFTRPSIPSTVVTFAFVST